MAYSTAKLTSVVDCDLVLNRAAKEKSDLEFKKSSEQRQQKAYSENFIEIDEELQSVVAEIAATETIINTLPDGVTKNETIKKKKKLEYKKFLLEDRKESYGVVSLLEQEMGLARLDLQLTEVNAFITEVTARKAAI